MSCHGRDSRLAIRRLILVDHTFGCCLVQGTRSGVRQLSSPLGITSGCGLMEPTNRGLQRRLRRLVTLTSLLVGLDAFELGLDVRHDRPLELFLIWWWGRCCAGATDNATSGVIGGPNSPYHVRMLV